MYQNVVAFSQRTKLSERCLISSLASQVVSILGGVWAKAAERSPWFNADLYWIGDPTKVSPTIAADTAYESHRTTLNMGTIAGRQLPLQTGVLAATRVARPDKIGVILQGKLPGQIRVELAGYHDKEAFVEESNFVAAALHMGYGGTLNAFSDARHGHEPQNTEKVELILGEEVLSLTLRYGENNNVVSELLKFCRLQRLSESSLAQS